MATPLVEFEQFACTFPGAEEPSLDGVDLALEAGTFVVLAGPSGSGKTTLALATNGIVQHVYRALTRGDVRIAGASVADARPSDLAAVVGMIFQEPESQFVSLYVRDEIAFGPENLLLPRDEILRRMSAVSRRTGIESLADRFVYELSGGQKQKVAVAAILAMEPKVLVLDEPTANLDPQSARDIWRLAAALRDEGMAILAIEKNLDQVLGHADRLIVLDRGRVCFDGPPREIVAEHGRELLDTLGVWLPQTAELATIVAARTGHRPKSIPFTAAEARDAFAEYEIRVPPVVVSTPVSSEVPATPIEPPPVLLMRLVTYRYPNGPLALDGINVSIGADEVVAICGPNGSGKSTLVKHFVGLLKPTSGEVEVLGRPTVDLGVRDIARRVGFVFQDPEHQFVKDTVADELRFSLRVAGVPEEQRDAIAGTALRELGLEGLDARHPFSLSGGEKRRLSVATVTVTRPNVLILDEPTYGQDRLTTLSLMKTILGRHEPGPDLRTGPTVTILVTHDLRLVADYATRAVVLDAGRIVFDGPPVKMFAQPDLLARARLELPPVVELAQELRRAGRIRVDLVSLDALAAAMH
jgi:energy-coupling factor transport system ATP-binding protein